jgi:hypothetical protein
MRRVTRNLILALLGVLLVLLALGALPGLLKSGDPYYLTATAANASGTAAEGTAAATATTTDSSGGTATENATGANATATANATRPAVDVTNLSARRFPYTTAALADGRSDPYWRGPLGLKEAFTHSPFDELDALRGRNRNATDGDAVYVRENGTLYRLAVRQEP